MTEETSDTKQSIKTQILHTLGIFVLLVPLGSQTFSLDPVLMGTALICTGLMLTLQHQVRQTFAPPVWLRWALLPALVCGPPFLWMTYPSPVAVLISLFAFTWVLGRSPLGRLPFWSRGLLLFLLAWRGLSQTADLPVFDFPRFPTHTFIWVSIVLIIPLGIATQERLRPFSKGVFLLLGVLVYLAASLFPLAIQTATGYKEVGEPERYFYQLEPLPGFRSVPNLGSETYMPSELRSFEDPLLAVELLDEMVLLLHPRNLKELSGDLPDERSIFFLRQSGFLKMDREGLYVPPESYGTPEAPENMDARILETVADLAVRTSFASTEETRPTLLRLRNLSLVDTIPNNPNRFRLTRQARTRFENGLYPRQIRFLASLDQEKTPVRIRHQDIAPGWDFSFEETLEELIDLVDREMVTVDETRSWHTPAYEAFTLKGRVALHLLLTPALGTLLIWIARKPSKRTLMQLISFGAAMAILYGIPHSQGTGLPFVYQAVWSTMWLPFATLLMGLSMMWPHQEEGSDQGPSHQNAFENAPEEHPA